jgi:hypothetical protein
LLEVNAHASTRTFGSRAYDKIEVAILHRTETLEKVNNHVNLILKTGIRTDKWKV